MKSIRTALTVVALLSLAMPTAGHAEPVVTNPFGNLTASIVSQPSGTTPGVARLTIVTANGGAFRNTNDTIYFGLRIMGSEDQELKSFKLTGTGNCIVSDFAGNGSTGGYQGAPIFGTDTPAGSGNSHMRMIGGRVKPSCGNIQIDVTFRARPLVTYYAAFFGYTPAPWHSNYGQAPWNVAPTGGNGAYQNWWDLWGTFDTLGYSNACTNVTGTAVSCG